MSSAPFRASQVGLENTNHCNAACVMCPREKQTRPLGYMDLAHSERPIKEIAEHNDVVERVHMRNFGEPLRDYQLPKSEVLGLYRALQSVGSGH